MITGGREARCVKIIGEDCGAAPLPVALLNVLLDTYLLLLIRLFCGVKTRSITSGPSREFTTNPLDNPAGVGSWCNRLPALGNTLREAPQE